MRLPAHRGRLVRTAVIGGIDAGRPSAIPTGEVRVDPALAARTVATSPLA